MGNSDEINVSTLEGEVTRNREKGRLMLCAVNEKEIAKDLLHTRLSLFFEKQLQHSYSQETEIKESLLIFVGDGRVGKTETLQNLLSKKFEKGKRSTVVLDMHNVFMVDYLKPANWKPVNPSDVAVQRVKNVLPTNLIKAANLSDEPKRKFHLAKEKEIIETTVKDEQFVQCYTEDRFGYQTDEYYFRALDFGGQRIFSCLHPIFLTKMGTYVLVFNCNDFTDTQKQRIQFWGRSLNLHAANAGVILVGTHWNDVDPKNTINEEIGKLVQKSMGELSIVKNDNFNFFPIENSLAQSPLKSKIKLAISKVITGANGVKTDRVKRRLPVGCVLFMRDYFSRDKYVSKKAFTDEAQEAGLNEDEIEATLQAYVHMGLILYFPDLNKDAEKNFIILQPVWLSSVLGKFIFDKDLHQYNVKFSPKLYAQKEEYLRTALISHELLVDLLRELTDELIRFVISLSSSLFIMVEYEFSKAGKAVKKYQVLSLVPHLKKPLKVGEVGDYPDMAFRFPLGMPQYVFPNLCGQLIQELQVVEGTGEPVIFSDGVIASFGRYQVVLVNKEKKNRVWVKVRGSVSYLPYVRKLASRVEKKLYDLQKIDVKLILFRENDYNTFVNCSDFEKHTREQKLPNPLTNKFVKRNFFSRFEDRKTHGYIPIKDIHVFLAHSWANGAHEKVKEVKVELNKLNVECWLDETNMSHNIETSMIHGLKDAKTIAFFVTEEYFRRCADARTNAAREFNEIAAMWEKSIAVILEEKCCKESKWKGNPVKIVIDNLKQEEKKRNEIRIFDLSSLGKRRNNIPELAALITKMRGRKYPPKTEKTNAET
eukprot:snap_masked-scaffold_5-processed-gene-5.24-mRNA-1 protein AED:1.00 eAED:1.00 QI:0/0/0/0/1/1/2/0/820